MRTQWIACTQVMARSSRKYRRTRTLLLINSPVHFLPLASFFRPWVPVNCQTTVTSRKASPKQAMTLRTAASGSVSQFTPDGSGAPSTSNAIQAVGASMNPVGYLSLAFFLRVMDWVVSCGVPRIRIEFSALKRSSVKKSPGARMAICFHVHLAIPG